MGIGLTLVKHLVELHGGRVAAFSEGGRGTEMMLYLPAKLALTDDMPALSTAPRAPRAPLARADTTSRRPRKR